MQVNLFPNFTSDKLHLQLWFFTCLLYWELPAQIFDFFNKIPVRVLLDVLFCMFRFSRASFNAPTSSFITLWHNLGTKTHRTLTRRLCNFYVWNYKFMLIFNAKVVTHNIMIRIKTGQLSQSHKVMKFYKINCDLVKPNLCFPFWPIILKCHKELFPVVKGFSLAGPRQKLTKTLERSQGDL